MTLDDLRICNLKDEISYRDTVIDRIWNAFWRPYGAERVAVERALDDVLAADGFPFTLVALDNGNFAGTVTSIEHDVSGRPDLFPCVAALWVEPSFRGKRLGHRLVDAALIRLAEAGRGSAYLPAKQPLRRYYLDMGWTLVEETVGPDLLDIFQRDTRRG